MVSRSDALHAATKKKKAEDPVGYARERESARLRKEDRSQERVERDRARDEVYRKNRAEELGEEGRQKQVQKETEAQQDQHQLAMQWCHFVGSSNIREVQAVHSILPIIFDCC